MTEELNPILQGQSGPNESIYFRALYYLHSQLADSLTEHTDEEGLPTAAWGVVSVDQSPFSALADRYQSNALWGIIDFAEQPGGAFLFLSSDEAASFLDIPSKVLDDDAYAMIDILLQRFCDYFKEAWSDIQEFEPQLGTFPSAPSLGELQEIFMGLSPQTPLIVTTFRGSSPAKPATRVAIAIPLPYLIPLATSLEAAAEATYSNSGGENVNERLSHIGDTPTALVVSLGSTTMTVSELQNLEEEDVIVLDQLVSAPINIRIGKGAVVKGKPGTSLDGARLAVQITDLGDH
ncbi:MAG TPA: FliM/FliN family flagellar motor switch protein [Chroococcales cyanobacterium]|jgi:flagellar motor switch/type III secretory pathway protein FliN